MTSFRKVLLALVAIGALLTLTAIPSSASGSHSSRTYEVTVENLTPGQIFTPPIWATHGKRVDFVEVGQPAPYGVKEIAENGNLEPLDYAWSLARGVRDHGIAPDGPVTGGTSRSFEITAPGNAKRLTTISMVVCTNDGFTGLDSQKLPRGLGHSVTIEAMAYDAGTEKNTEALADLVPPCSGGETGTGNSNPDLAEGGVISAHGGITNGGGDPALLDPAVWGFEQPVARYTITRTS